MDSVKALEREDLLLIGGGVVIAGVVVYMLVTGRSWSDLLSDAVVGTGEGLGKGTLRLLEDIVDPQGLAPDVGRQIWQQTTKPDSKTKQCPRDFVPDPWNKGGCRRLAYQVKEMPWWAYLPGAPIMIYDVNPDMDDRATKHYRTKIK
jgi:hypothetical protein